MGAEPRRLCIAKGKRARQVWNGDGSEPTGDRPGQQDTQRETSGVVSRVRVPNAQASWEHVLVKAPAFEPESPLPTLVSGASP